MSEWDVSGKRLSVRITQLTFAAVASAATPSPPVPRQPDPAANDFLCRHVDRVREKTRTHQTYPGWFADPVARDLFRDLLRGTEAEFATAAETLTKRLTAKMDARARRGLLVFLRADDAADTFGGVLKLDVEAENAGVLRLLSTGEAQLGMVTDLLTGPDNLQKAAVVASDLAPSRVMVVDRMTHAAAYFPRAFGISTAARPSAGSSVLLWAVDQVSPSLSGQVAEALPGVASGEPSAVLDALEEAVPGLAGGARAAVADVLERHDPPVGYIETGRPASVKVVAGEITISGPASVMRRLVTVSVSGSAEDQAWTVHVDSPGPPEWIYPQAGRFRGSDG